MFVTPMLAMPSDIYGRPPRRPTVSVSGPATRLRLSTASSDTSSLHRTSSTASRNSSSASSIELEEAKKSPQQRKTRSSSFILPRAFQPFHKKALSQSHTKPELHLPCSPPPPPPPPPQRLQRKPPLRPKRPSQETLKWSETVVKSPYSRSGPPESQWQCSDLVVKCKDDVYHVDRTIMCHHSRWFKRICAIVKTPKASKNVIDLSADDADAVAAMMQYCYQLDYTDRNLDPLRSVDDFADLRPHVDVYMLAERYGVSGLKKLALEKFEDLATSILKVNGNEEQFLTAVRAIYKPSRKANADELRYIAIRLCANHVEGFISGSNPDMQLVFESIDNIPDFRTDLFEEMARRWK